MHFKSIDLVRIHVKDIPQSKTWYEKAFGMAPTEDEQFYVEFRFPSGFGFAIAQADTKNPLSTGGSTTYFKVSDIKATIAHFEKHGAAVFRGPLDVPDGTVICQIKDPFENVFGLVSEI